MIKAIIFDFDGVIAESNNVKTEVFVKLFKDYPKRVREEIRKFHLQNGGMSRFDKFRYIYANVLNELLPDAKFNELCRDFKKFVFDGVVSAPLAKGVEDFLKENKTKYDMYIVSGTPQEEIRDIVKKQNLDTYFLGIYGSPKTKKELIENILKKKGYDSSEVIFLGDSINDYEGAMAVGIEFVAKISDNTDVDIFPGVSPKTTVKSIKEFKRYLSKT